MNDIIFKMMLLGALSTGGALPFWAVSNQNGIMPDNSGSLALVQAYKPFDESKAFQWEAGASLAAIWQPVAPEDPSSSPVHAMVDELYAGARWKVLRADIGMMHRESEFLGSDPALGSLSVTEGHVIESNNARTMPGYKLTLEPWAVPFTNEKLWIQGIWADYKTLDVNRYVSGALVHRINGFMRWDVTKRFYLQFGLDHYALWGGTPPGNAIPVKVTWNNYWRIATGRSANAEGSKSDQMNCLGDHGGAERLRMGWRGNDYDITFQWEKPYADKSGMRFNNIPDGVYTLHWSLKDKDRWVSDALLEFHYTMWQSGSLHDNECDADGNQLKWSENKHLNIFGGDDYFTNGEYRSGWTHFGRAICGPLFLTGNRGTTKTVVNNRYKAIHAGLSGKLFRFAPYRLMLTFSDNYGTYGTPYVPGATSWGSGWNWWEPNTLDKGLKQFSAAFTGYVPFEIFSRSALDVVYGIYADAGEVLKNNFGFTLGVRYRL